MFSSMKLPYLLLKKQSYILIPPHIYVTIDHSQPSPFPEREQISPPWFNHVSFFTTLDLSLYFYATPVGSISWAPECSHVFWPSGKDLSCMIWPQSGVSEQVFCLASAAFDKIELLFKYLETLLKKKKKSGSSSENRQQMVSNFLPFTSFTK